MKNENMSYLEMLFPRIVSTIELMWRYPELDVYFSKLIIDDRGDRQGFPKEVINELLFLQRLHHSLSTKNENDPWNHTDAIRGK